LSYWSKNHILRTTEVEIYYCVGSVTMLAGALRTWTNERIESVAQVVECLPSKHQTLSSIFSAQKTQECGLLRKRKKAGP
jgi:hypothetical protein